jgi:hypothetical protein
VFITSIQISQADEFKSTTEGVDKTTDGLTTDPTTDLTTESKTTTDADHETNKPKKPKHDEKIEALNATNNNLQLQLDNLQLLLNNLQQNLTQTIIHRDQLLAVISKLYNELKNLTEKYSNDLNATLTINSELQQNITTVMSDQAEPVKCSPLKTIMSIFIAIVLVAFLIVAVIVAFELLRPRKTVESDEENEQVQEPEANTMFLKVVN